MTVPTYTVIGSTGSRTARVLWALEEIGHPYTHVPAEPRSKGALEFNLAGKVPILLVDGAPVTDSTAIIQFLADRHGQLTYPAGTLARAHQDSLTQFLLDEFDAALWLAARHSFILPKEIRQPSIKESLKWEFQRSQKTLVSRMSDGPFLMGDVLTVPDIIATHCGVWATQAHFEITEPRFRDYIDRLRQRDAFRRAMGR